MSLFISHAILTVFLVFASYAQSDGIATPNYEQMALDVFLRNYWNDSLFVEECTGITFDSTFAIRIFADSSVYPIVEGYMPDSLWQKYGKAGYSEKANLSIVLRDTTLLKRTPWSRAPDESEGIPTLERHRDFINLDKKFSAYLLRFSQRLITPEYVFLDLWIKEGYHSSGTHILFQFSRQGRIISMFIRHLCDEWG